MIKLIALTVTFAAFTASSSFADCGSCKKDKKKDDDKTKSPAVQTVDF